MKTDLVIVGAGAAGIGAAKAAQQLGIDTILLEASHRIGGRAYTETPLPGIHFDLGCHWLHTASRNPLTQLLKTYAMEVNTWSWQSIFHKDGAWIDGKAAGFDAFSESTYLTMQDLATRGQDVAVADVYPRDHEWTGSFDYWVSLLFSTDPDQVSIRDFSDFEDTGDGEDWPVKQGLGTLIARFGADLPLSLNTAVKAIDSRDGQVVIDTNKGRIEASSVIITVSTGILNAGEIKFTPDLPQWKQDAIAHLQLGNHNRICLIYDRNVFGDYAYDTATCLDGDDTPMYFEIRPFGLNYAVGSTGGRFADWLERAGQDASVDYAREKLVHMFGHDAGRNIVNTVVTAWRGDPWVRGAYSATAPGHHGAREKLGTPVDERIFFAGEATSLNFMDTVHGAYISGVREALRVDAALNNRTTDLAADPEELAWSLTKPEAEVSDQVSTVAGNR